MIGTSADGWLCPDWTAPVVGPAFFVAVIGLAVVANVAYAVTTPFAAGQPLDWARAVLGQAFLVAWVLISLKGLAFGITVPEEPQGPGPWIFFAACVFWTLPYLVLASRRRTLIWNVIALLSIAIAVFGIVYVYINSVPVQSGGAGSVRMQLAASSDMV
jgi:hypothetical protein